MRLINVETYELEQFAEQECPSYAILSHTWQGKEVTFSEWNDWLTGKHEGDTPGIQKITAFCNEANRFEVFRINQRYAWADTCCINKQDPTELSEAINSMFRYYQNAQVCKVYLADVDEQPGSESMIAAICRSTWFNRGWTLQELLAPTRLEFLNSHWMSLGILGDDKDLTEAIAQRTGISTAVLRRRASPSEFSVATRQLLAPSPLHFEYALNNEVVQHYQDVDGWVEAYGLTNLGLRLRLPLLRCGKMPSAYHPILNCAFRKDCEGPLALTVRRRGQKGDKGYLVEHIYECCAIAIDNDYPHVSKLHFSGNSIPASSSKVCSATHLSRMSIVSEELLLEQGYVKNAVTISRESVSKVPPASALPRDWYNNKAASSAPRIRLRFDGNTDLPLPKRGDYFPQDKWLQSEDVFVSQGDCGIITYKSDWLPDLAFVVGYNRPWAPLELGVFELTGTTALEVLHIVSGVDSWFIMAPGDSRNFSWSRQIGFTAKLETRKAMGTQFLTLHICMQIWNKTPDELIEPWTKDRYLAAASERYAPQAPSAGFFQNRSAVLVELTDC
ncbi:Vegetative incompatibility protein HET-E-1 [Cercospora beticola]|uniref:Vegetative incompatibility protein HET-E-1 n=1 Tax=Cercospora beticola TaxID=122368 RepID=A0A2G5HMD4_CERBT|nr:Vegetative incompatibility protein HET-E-1 [Cercospora beticola]PIA93423.1 Vegetative incompatibility protein HET-E-1 [Cercospora beticola]WPB01537.1 hypothetical protein RHO25_006164 [Cercospora beticola]CAK1363671.1 unnamed protein product [Cercospora beticola]